MAVLGQLHNRRSDLLGAHNVVLKADTATRSAYLDRAEHRKLRKHHGDAQT